ncbi:MAG TPA: hypothetical protein VK207_09370 [Bacteroidales bacterium]|nr:hypothetical protein [Bacteroidales bacterium]
MKQLFFLLLYLFFTSAFASEVPDSTKSLSAAATFSINSNGIASIPAFSLGKPAIIAALNLGKGRFSYDPVLAYSTDMKPWFIDSWLHYKIISKPNFELRAGFNFSNFFTHVTLNEQDIIKGERYWAGAVEGFWKTSSRNVLSLMYWSDNGMDPGSISGHYVSLENGISNLQIGKSFLFGAGLQLFMVSYDGPNDGVFVSPKLSMGIRNKPVLAFFQATQVLVSNIEPDPGFRWNVGMAYSF